MSPTTRREALQAAGGLTVAVLAGSALGEGGVAVAVEPGRAAFLAEAELRTLRAAVDVFVPPDEDAGAVQAGCAEAIDALLGAFTVSPPRIYAGAPFSDRAGAARNDFERFLTLDRYEELAWRLRIEGSNGRGDLERNGAVPGWQRTYRAGLAALAADGFADKPRLERELILRRSSDPAVATFVDIAWPHTWQFMYGAPEYGGNSDLVGWELSVYQGDVHPRGWSDEEVEAGPVPGTFIGLEDAPLPRDELLALAAFGGSSELVHNLLARTEGSASPLRDAVRAALDGAKEGGRGA